VAEIMLKSTGIVTFIRELVAASMAKHMRVRGKGQASRQPDSRHELAYITRAHGAATFGDEQIWGVRPVPAELSQGPKLRASQGMGGWNAVLETPYMQETSFQVYLIPA